MRNNGHTQFFGSRSNSSATRAFDSNALVVQAMLLLSYLRRRPAARRIVSLPPTFQPLPFAKSLISFTKFLFESSGGIPLGRCSSIARRAHLRRICSRLKLLLGETSARVSSERGVRARSPMGCIFSLRAATPGGEASSRASPLASAGGSSVTDRVPAVSPEMAMATGRWPVSSCMSRSSSTALAARSIANVLSKSVLETSIRETCARS